MTRHNYGASHYLDLQRIAERRKEAEGQARREEQARRREDVRRNGTRGRSIDSYR